MAHTYTQKKDTTSITSAISRKQGLLKIETPAENRCLCFVATFVIPIRNPLSIEGLDYCCSKNKQMAEVIDNRTCFNKQRMHHPFRCKWHKIEKKYCCLNTFKTMI